MDTKTKQFILYIAIAAALVLAYFMWSGNSDTKSSSLPPLQMTEWVDGKKDSKVVMIEYADFQCPACKAFNPIIGKIKEEYKDRVAFVFRPFPLQGHLNALPSATAAELAGQQGKYFEMVDALYTNQEEWATSKTPFEYYEKYAQALGLDMNTFKQGEADESIKTKLAESYKGGVQAGVTGTPTFFIQGKKFELPDTRSASTEEEALQIIMNGFKAELDKGLASTQ